MELAQELIFTALIALLFSYLVARLLSFSMAAGADSGSGSGSVDEELKEVDDDNVNMEELQFGEKMKVGILESQNRVEFVEETTEKVDQFQEELHQVVETEFVGLQKDDSSEEMITEKEADTDDGLVEEKSAIESAISKDDVIDIEQSEEINVAGKESKDCLVGDDDWEGIERSELENVFGEAVKFVGSGFKDVLLRDLQMEMYALHKIATEGPCYEPQPMPLMLSARSKWHCLHCARNAWQKLGNMNPEEAMERYVTLLSDRVPGWMKENYSVDDKLESEEIGKPDAVSPLDTSSFKGDQTNYTRERNLELKTGSEEVI